MKPELGEHVQDQPNKKRAIAINIIFYFLLLFLAAASYFWELWRSGSLRIPVNLILLAVIVLVGILAFFSNRFSNWHPRWIWLLWLILTIAMPFLTSAFDTTIARVIQLNALITITIIFFSFPVIQTAKNQMLVIVSFFLLVILWLFPYVLMNQQRLIGPCNLLSIYRRQGCERSLQFGYFSPFNNVELSSSEKSQLIYPYNKTVWLEPINRWEALFQSTPFYFEDSVDYAASRMDGKLLDTYHFVYFPGYGLGQPHTQIFTSVYTRIDLKSGEQLGQERLKFETEDELNQAYEAAVAAQEKSDSSSEAYTNAISFNRQWQAISFGNNQLQIWHDANANEVNDLTELTISFDDIEVPENDPYWSIDPGMPFSCLAFSQDGSLLAAHAGDEYEMLHIYDVVDKELITAVSIETSNPCPEFSPDNAYLALVNDIEQDSIYLLSSSTGEHVATISLESYDDVQHLSFAPTNDYLAVTVQFNKQSRSGAGLIINLETIVNKN